MRYWLITGTIIAMTCSGNAQQFQSLKDFHPIPSTYRVMEDRLGFLWLATVDGVMRYDGYQIEKFQHHPADSNSIPTNDAKVIFEDDNGLLWIGLGGLGLTVMDRQSGKFQKRCLPFRQNQCHTPVSVWDIEKGPGNEIWVATGNGVYVFDQDDHSVLEHYTRTTSDSSLSHTYAINLLYDKKGRMWIGTNNGVNLFLGDSQFTNFRSDSTFVRGQITDLISHPGDSTVWIGAREAPYPIYLYDEWSRHIVPYELFPPSDGHRPVRITFDHQNRLWISLRSVGLYVMDIRTGSFEFYDPDKGTHHGFRSYGTGCVYTDRSGNIWIGGTELYMWPNSKKPIRSILTEGYLVSAVFADHDRIWYSARKPMRWNRHTFETEEYWPEGHPVNIRMASMRNPEKVFIYKYEALDDHHLFFITTRNIFIWDKRDDSFVEVSTMAGGPLRDFAFGNHDNIWICPNQSNLVEFDLITHEYRRMPDQLAQKLPYPRTIARDHDDYLWIGSTSSGLFRFDEDSGEIISFAPTPGDSVPGLSNYYVRDIYVHSDSTLWIATNIGLDHFDPRTFEFINFNKKNGLSQENVTSIVEDDYGNLWLGTQTGLVKMNVDDLSFTHFSLSVGFCNSIFSERAVYKDENGWLYFGGNKGVDFFHPDSIGQNSIAPLVYVRSIRVHNELAPFKSTLKNEPVELTFNHNENFIEIELVGLQYTAPAANQYAYRLEGSNSGSKSWKNLGNSRSVTLANMAPGHYTLHAKAANADGVWSEATELLRFHIVPPFWKAGWFYLMLAFFLLCAILAIYFFRIRRIREKETLRSEFNKKIAEIELKALQAQMNPHFLFNSLNSVKSLIGKHKNKEATLYLTRFSQLIRQILNNSRNKFVKLSDELRALQLYLELESMRFQDQFEFSIVVEKDVNADFLEVPPLLLQPYVENAIWHGLLPKERGERILKVQVRRSGDFVEMTVEDNGIGRRNAQKLAAKSGKKRQSLGMRITDDRLKFLQAIYGAGARVEIDDLSAPTGTRVTIYLPLPE